MSNLPEPYQAIVMGATGAVGRALVATLLASPRCGRVTSLGRRTTDLFDHATGREKLSQIVVDFVNLAALETEVARHAAGHHVALSTLGVGQPSKADPAEFQRIDVDCTGAFARGARAAGVTHFSLLGAVSTNAKSHFRYVRVKGMAEAVVTAPGFERVSLFRPSLLRTKDIRYGFGDRLNQALFPAFAWMMPKRFRPIWVHDLGRAMALNVERPGSGVEILHWPEFRAVLEGAPQQTG